MGFKTEQENFWAGEFGKSYIDRNIGSEILASNLNFFSTALKQTDYISDCIEFGANIGMNLIALKLLFPKLELEAIELNEEATKILKKNIPEVTAHQGSIITTYLAKKFDLVLIKGVLIHINPDYLSTVYKNLYDCANKYILICEYYNRTPVSIDYRGHKDKLFKRDFCGEIMDQFNDLELVDYGFAYHRDKNFPQDDISWFLLKKGPIKC